MRHIAFLFIFLALSASAENFNIKMVNTDSSGQIMVFDPPFLIAFRRTFLEFNIILLQSFFVSKDTFWVGLILLKYKISLA